MSSSIKNNFLSGIALILLLIGLSAPGFAQGTVTYGLKVNGKEIKRDHPLRLIYKNDIALLHSGNKVQQYMDYNHKSILKYLSASRQVYLTETNFDSLVKARLSPDTATILGQLCHKAQLVIRSNHIEVWYTNALPLKGSPSLEVAPYLGLILKMVRNGNYELYATDITLNSPADTLWHHPPPGEKVDEATFRSLVIKNRYTTIPVFTDRQINFGDSIVNPASGQSNTVYRYSGGTVIAKKIHLPEQFHGQVFATLTQYSNGDAYDRTGCVFVIPTKDSISFLTALQEGIKVLPTSTDHEGNNYQGIVSAKNYQPPVELIRFFTPFGVRAYNKKVQIKGYHWADSVIYSQDITDLLPLLQGEVWIGIYIGNYDKKGHTVSLKLKYYNDDSEEKDRLDTPWIFPLFNTLNIMEMSGQNYGKLFGNDSLKVRFFVPEGVKDLRLRYLSTGHGGWGGGDEFNPKVNTLFIDGQKVFSYTPWRTDCATYRLKNPSSGNFRNGLSSSDYSRSGWCPGTSTNPVYVPLPQLTPGWHTFTLAIPQGRPEGSSFSFWNVSGVLTGSIRK